MVNQYITKLDDDGKANTSYKENKKTSVQTNYQPVKLQTGASPYEVVSFTTITNDQPDTKLIGETK